MFYDAVANDHGLRHNPIKALIGPRPIGWITALSAKTTQAQIDALATLTPEELAQHAELDKGLKENNPKEKAGLLRLRARRAPGLTPPTP